MVKECVLLLVLLAVNDRGLAQVENDDGTIVSASWLHNLLGVKPFQPREARRDKEDMFWATRGKRSSQDPQFWAARGKRGISIKPNGLFGAIKGKRSLKPNGLFGLTGKRTSLKPNSLFALTPGKRSSFKPNSLFMMQTRKRDTFMKPNSLFTTIKGKRAMTMKPNGLFSLTKRDDEDSGFSDYMDWGSPAGLFGAYKRALKPNGLFGIKKRALKPNGLFYVAKKDQHDTEDELNEDYYDQDVIIDYEDDSDEDLDEDERIMKRDGDKFWATRGKKDDTNFWATRGKRDADFWAVRG